MMKAEPRWPSMRIPVKVIDALGVKCRGSALDAMDLIALVEKKLGQIGAILARHASDQRPL